MVPIKVAVDVDGTADADPVLFRKLMDALRKRGDKVIVLTGCDHSPVAAEDKAQKKAYLKQLGLGDSYDKLRVFANPPGKAKAAYCQKHAVDLLIDNSLSNARLAPCGTFVLVPWRSITP